MAGQPKRRARRAAEQNSAGRRRRHPRPTHEEVAALYRKTKWDSWEQLRTALVQHGIVEHGLNPFDVIQRAIDDVTTDYLLLRRHIDKDSQGDPHKLTSHPLYMDMEHQRECMVRYSTFAMQYDIQKRQLRLTESRIALLAATLRVVLLNMGVPREKIKEVPSLLIKELEQGTPYHGTATSPARLDPARAIAMTEIISNPDIEVEVKLDE